MKQISCGIILTNGSSLLLGKAGRGDHWDLPKGKMDRNELPIETAIRELKEETDLDITWSDLQYLGDFKYTKRKKLKLFVSYQPYLPKIEDMVCTSMFVFPKNLKKYPELEAFEYVKWENTHNFVVPSLQNVLIEAKCRMDQLNEIT